MQFTVDNEKHLRRVRLIGQFTFADNQTFKEIVALSQESDVRNIDLDFSAVEFIDSAGLGMLLLFREECRKHKIELSIRSAKGQVEKIFQISRFDQLFSMSA